MLKNAAASQPATQSKQTQPQKAQPNKTELGRRAEDRALDFLLARGLRLIDRNWKTPGRGGGELDLVLQDSAGTLVFVEVRARATARFGGAAASIGAAKRARVALAAQLWAAAHGVDAPWRFDVVTLEGKNGADGVRWLPGALDFSP